MVELLFPKQDPAAVGVVVLLFTAFLIAPKGTTKSKGTGKKPVPVRIITYIITIFQ